MRFQTLCVVRKRVIYGCRRRRKYRMILNSLIREGELVKEVSSWWVV